MMGMADKYCTSQTKDVTIGEVVIRPLVFVFCDNMLLPYAVAVGEGAGNEGAGDVVDCHLLLQPFAW